MPVTNAEILNQIHLSGEAPCSLFQPHPMKANFCVGCSKLVNKHEAASIPDDDCLLRAIEFSQSKEKVPSCIEERREGRGGLWHGGFKAVMNHDFLRAEGITHVVNTAKGLEMFGRKYTVSLKLNSLPQSLEHVWGDLSEQTVPSLGPGEGFHQQTSPVILQETLARREDKLV
ncbi:hypothetical protein GBAR_LOCUS21679 [Geodia barretti]|uniref:Uncharacterized protein n=1 Tax=Geodia barretti TaxID=519541 RepID=A0AA35X429_GEOBA|nr:hypothetical protein GBAR_LOCUS21679 [Geodia barretti]